MSVEYPKQALVLAAGLGTRMAPITSFTPKPLIPFFDQPLIEVAFRKLTDAGVTRIVVNAHHLGRQLQREVLENIAPKFPGVRIDVVLEDPILGTGGAIAALREWFDPGPFWVVNSDAVFFQNLSAMAEQHALGGHDATLMVTRAERHRGLRFLAADEHLGLITRTPEAMENGYAFCGVHINEQGLLDVLPRDTVCCVLRQGHLPWLARGARIHLYETKDFWADLGTPERYLEAHRVAYEKGLGA